MMLSMLRDGRAVALLLAATLTILSNSLISPALPELRLVFRDDPRAAMLVPLLVTAPSLMVAVLAPVAGLIADRVGRRTQLLAGVLLFAVAGSAGLWLSSLTALLVSRLVLGVAVAMVMTAQSALAGDYFDRSARARFMGAQIAATNFSGFMFLLLAGWLAGRSPFLPFAIYAVALLYLPFMWHTLVEPDRRTVTAEEPGTNGTAGNWILMLTAGASFAFMALVCFYIIPTQMPFHLATIGHGASSATASALGILTLVAGAVSLLYGRVRAAIGRGPITATGFFGFAAGFGLLAVTDRFALVLAACAMLGAATGLLFPVLTGFGLEVAPAARRGLASGVVTLAIFLGQFVSPLAGQPLIAALGFSAVAAGTAALCVMLGLGAWHLLSDNGHTRIAFRTTGERSGRPVVGAGEGGTCP